MRSSLSNGTVMMLICNSLFFPRARLGICAYEFSVPRCDIPSACVAAAAAACSCCVCHEGDQNDIKMCSSGASIVLWLRLCAVPEGSAAELRRFKAQVGLRDVHEKCPSTFHRSQFFLRGVQRDKFI